MKIPSMKDHCNPLKMHKHMSSAIEEDFIYCRGTEILHFLHLWPIKL
jgi:hypothetical protein